MSPDPRSHDVLAMRYQTSGLPNGLGISGIGPGRWPPLEWAHLSDLCVVPLCSSGGLVASHRRLRFLRCRESDDTTSPGLVSLRARQRQGKQGAGIGTQPPAHHENLAVGIQAGVAGRVKCVDRSKHNRNGAGARRPPLTPGERFARVVPAPRGATRS